MLAGVLVEARRAEVILSLPGTPRCPPSTLHKALQNSTRDTDSPEKKIRVSNVVKDSSSTNEFLPASHQVDQSGVSTRTAS